MTTGIEYAKLDALEAERVHCLEESARLRAQAIAVLVEQGLDRVRVEELVDLALEREDLAGYRAGDDRLRRVQAALDTLTALYTHIWPAPGEAAPAPWEVSLAQVDYDDAIQIRVQGTDPERVAEYTRSMREGDNFPPLTLFFDREAHRLWLSDGFHRFQAARRISLWTSFPCYVRSGDRREAELYAATCNVRHGLRLTNADKRAAVQRLLQQAPELSDREIARRCGVSQPFVSSIRAGSDNRYQTATRQVMRGGKTYTMQVGRPAPERVESAPAEQQVDAPAEEAIEPADQPPVDVADTDSQAAQAEEQAKTARQMRVNRLCAALTAGDLAGLRAALQGSDVQDLRDAILVLTADERFLTGVQTLFQAMSWPTSLAAGSQVCPECGGECITMHQRGKPEQMLCKQCGWSSNRAGQAQAQGDEQGEDVL